jgi:hypothetical protein
MDEKFIKIDAFFLCTRGSEPAEGRASAQKALNPLVSEITPAALKIHPYPYSISTYRVNISPTKSSKSVIFNLPQKIPPS